LTAVLIVAVAAVLVLPAVAAAAVYQVNNTGDGADLVGNGVCLTLAGNCTLRAAIEESNASTGVRDEITFSASFDRQLADTVKPATPLPAIEDPASVIGGDCFGEDGPDAPCAGVEGPSDGAALTVEDADGVVIEGLSVTGARFGIDVVDGSKEFVAKNDWIGLDLLGGESGNGTGIFLDPGSDGATIGGLDADERNVISGNEFDGLDLQGASEAVIQGNYFGVNPPGPVGLPGGDQEMANAKDIEITDSTLGGGIKAEHNLIGATIVGAAFSSLPCDGGCNVISGAQRAGVDLNGDGSLLNERPATGPTLVRSNYVGLAADGETVVENSEYGVFSGASDNAEIGGVGTAKRNYFAGGQYGIYGENGEDFTAAFNWIGRNGEAEPVSPPSAVGIFNTSNGVTESGRIVQNTLEMTAAVGIEQRFTGASISFNKVFGGEIGILTKGASVGEGNRISVNEVRETSADGILIENDSNQVVGNEVEKAGGDGIRVRYAGTLPLASGTTGNVIGGDEFPVEENVLLHNTGRAIRIEDLEGSNNEVVRNHGEGNGGPFIDLVTPQPGLEPKGPNEGIQPPAFSAADAGGAKGTAQPGATIRVFRKSSQEPGELHAFLAEAVVDGSGNWSVAYLASVPLGTIVAATQTSESGGTSELATATTAAEGDGGGSGGGSGGEGGGGKGGGGSEGGGNHATPPETVILRNGPKPRATNRRRTFKFVSTEAGSAFQCKLDRKPFTTCTSPKKYKKLKPGKHVFKVRAIDRAGNVDPTPAKRVFKVLK
jgi:hypothetical protein